MILEEETLLEYSYLPMDLKPRSCKPILAICDECGKVRETHKDNYHSLCISCALKGNIHLLGHIQTKETRALMSVAHKGKYTGENSPNFKYGKRTAKAKSQAKRKRDLGYTLLYPLDEGEVGHRVTNKFVLGVPAEVHQQFAGLSRKKHRTHVLEWLKANDKKKYLKALCVLAKEPL
jgi:hypothetical protein